MDEVVDQYKEAADIRSVAVLGTGSVGASWAALFMAHGINVVAYDPSHDAEKRARDFIAAAWPALQDLGRAKTEVPDFSMLSFVQSAGEAAATADIIQENVPEREELKARVLTEVDAAAGPEKIIISSTGGIPPSRMQQHCKHPQRLVVLHPFNPTHLIPLVEVVGGKDTDRRVIEWAMTFARRLGKHPILLHAEASGHMTNRLQFALVREAVSCLLEGVASADDIDAALRYGLAPRWALMGSFMTLHLAGGPGGMKGILDHAGPALEQWWTPGPTPRLTPEVKQRLAEAAEEVSAGKPVNEWVQWRDVSLVDVLRLQQQVESSSPAALNPQTLPKETI